MKGKKALINYNISHVLTFEEYLNITWSKAMAKVAIDEIR
jgi:hypothetical protein